MSNSVILFRKVGLYLRLLPVSNTYVPSEDWTARKAEKDYHSHHKARYSEHDISFWFLSKRKYSLPQPWNVSVRSYSWSSWTIRVDVLLVDIHIVILQLIFAVLEQVKRLLVVLVSLLEFVLHCKVEAWFEAQIKGQFRDVLHPCNIWLYAVKHVHV